jgi:TMEM175 potassium channel family protein
MKPDRTADERETARLEAFSDAVFAIAITILVLNLKVPHLEGASSAHLASALLKQWPSYFAFGLSFATILIMWLNHHAQLQMVERIDARLMFSNGLLLLMVVAVPFPTALVSEYLTRPGGRAAVATYALLILMTNVVWNAFVWSMSGLVKPGVPPEAVADLRKQVAIGLPVYLVAVAAALISAYLGVAVLTAMWIFWGALAYRSLNTPGRSQTADTRSSPQPV